MATHCSSHKLPQEINITTQAQCMSPGCPQLSQYTSVPGGQTYCPAHKPGAGYIRITQSLCVVCNERAHYG